MIFRARKAPVKIRPKNAGMDIEVIKTALLPCFLVLTCGLILSQGQYAKQTSRSMNLRVTALTLKKFTGAPSTIASEFRHWAKMPPKSSYWTHFPGSVPASCVHFRQFVQNSMCWSVR
jgi:hypothetical protein